MPATSSSRFQRGRISFLVLVALALGISWLWREQIVGKITYFGNHDRLLYYLCNELGNYDSQAEFGRFTAWDEKIFAGVDRDSLPSVGGNFSPAKALMPWVQRPDFFRAAGFLPPALMLAAVLSAYAALRLVGSPLIAAAAAVVYVTSVYAQLNVSQVDMAGLLLISLPWGTRIIFSRPLNLATVFLLLAAALPVIYLGFAPQSAYIVGFWLLLAGFRSFREHSPRALFLLLWVLFVAALLCLPRVSRVLHALTSLQRMPEGGAEASSFRQLQGFFNVTWREILRWFDDGLFGRFPEEAARFDNNINLNEGFQVYASIFASLFCLKVLLRYRGRWFGALRPGAGLVAVSAWTFLLVVAVVFIPQVTQAVYLLFLEAPILHARIVNIGILPAAVLVAAGLQDWHDQAAPAASGSANLALGMGAALGVVFLALSPRLISRMDLTSMVDATHGPGHVFEAIRATGPEISTAIPRTPFSVQIGRPSPSSLWVTWEQTSPTDDFELELRRDGGAFASAGRKKTTGHLIDNVAYDAGYEIRVRAWKDGVPSPFSAIAATPSQAALEPIPAPGTPLRMNRGEIKRVLICGFLFGLILVVFSCSRPGGTQSMIIGLLATLIACQALQDADFRSSGPQTRSFPVPFKADNFFNAPGDVLRPPSDAELAQLHARLHPAQWRTVFITPAAFTGFATPHIAQFWQLRTIEGYLSGVPQRLAALPWANDALGFRTLSFRAPEQLDWELLAKLNVRYATTVTPEIYFNLPGAAAIDLKENPLPVTPRVFFARNTRPAATFVPSVGKAELPSSPVDESWVEGMDRPRAWPVEGAIQASFRGDSIELSFPAAAEPRFLVLNEMYHPGWSAMADGRSLPVYATNTIMRGLEVPSGVANVQLKFQPVSVPGTSWVFPLAGFTALAVTCFFSRRLRVSSST